MRKIHYESDDEKKILRIESSKTNKPKTKRKKPQKFGGKLAVVGIVVVLLLLKIIGVKVPIYIVNALIEVLKVLASL